MSKNALVALMSCFLFCLTGYAQTQLSMNKSAAEAYKAADKQLNETYRAILNEYKADTEFIANLKSAQRLWIKFRDAELKMKYPMDASYYGSIHPVCRANYLEKLTKERTKTLMQWLNGVEEGDMCAGSINLKSMDEAAYLISSNGFQGVFVGDLIANKMNVLEKDILKTGEGDFDILTIKDGNGTVIANVFPDPRNPAKVGDITVLSPLAKTTEGIHIGMTVGDLEKQFGNIEIHGSEIEGTTSVLIGNLRYTIDAHFWSYNIDQSKIDKETKITQIAITR
jgi:uncharacterized protein YecT (DUF1311 family)